MNKTIGELLKNAKGTNTKSLTAEEIPKEVEKIILELGAKKSIESQDNISHPSHYTMGTKETIEIIKDVTDKEFGSYCIGNVIKYISRYKYKNGVEDLKKAQQYIQFMIDDLEKEIKSANKE